MSKREEDLANAKRVQDAAQDAAIELQDAEQDMSDQGVIDSQSVTITELLTRNDKLNQDKRTSDAEVLTLQRKLRVAEERFNTVVPRTDAALKKLLEERAQDKAQFLEQERIIRSEYEARILALGKANQEASAQVRNSSGKAAQEHGNQQLKHELDQLRQQNEQLKTSADQLTLQLNASQAEKAAVDLSITEATQRNSVLEKLLHDLRSTKTEKDDTIASLNQTIAGLRKEIEAMAELRKTVSAQKKEMEATRLREQKLLRKQSGDALKMSENSSRITELTAEVQQLRSQLELVQLQSPKAQREQEANPAILTQLMGTLARAELRTPPRPTRVSSAAGAGAAGAANASVSATSNAVAGH